jgi:hypothetical protein
MAVGLHRSPVGASGTEPQPDDDEDHDHDEAADDCVGHAGTVPASASGCGTTLFKRRDVDNIQRRPVDLTFPQP